jgi:hypothetical protein
MEHFILKGDLAENAIMGYPDDSGDEEGSEKLLAEYELLGEFPGDPKEDYYQGMSFTTVYKRKSDGKLFGYTYWQGGGKYGEPYYESNGEELGYDDYDTYIFYEVTPFNVQGYYIKKD